jgi:hypothetical protein
MNIRIKLIYSKKHKISGGGVNIKDSTIVSGADYYIRIRGKEFGSEF